MPRPLTTTSKPASNRADAKLLLCAFERLCMGHTSIIAKEHGSASLQLKIAHPRSSVSQHSFQEGAYGRYLLGGSMPFGARVLCHQTPPRPLAAWPDAWSPISVRAAIAWDRRSRYQ